MQSLFRKLTALVIWCSPKAKYSSLKAGFQNHKKVSDRIKITMSSMIRSNDKANIRKKTDKTVANYIIGLFSDAHKKISYL